MSTSNVSARTSHTSRLDAARAGSDQQVIDGLLQEFDRSASPGMVIGVAREGVVTARRAVGLACVGLGVANRIHTRMRIGSAAKQFACLSALLLEEQGRLDVDAPIGRYLPELPPLQARPTLRQLMTHTGGLRDYLDLASAASGLRCQPAGKALAAQVRQREVNFEPGERQVYCNGGYHLLSLAIERAAGMKFEDFLQRRVFEPLSLRDTGSVPSDMAVVRNMATLHTPQPAAWGGGWRQAIFPTEEILGEGAIVSTVDDMLRWLAHMRGPHLLGSTACWKQMTTPATLDNGRVTAYGLGLWRVPYRGLELVYHPGGVYGGAAQLLTVPQQALDVVILSNGVAVNGVALSKRIVDGLLKDVVTGPAVPRLASSRRFKHLQGRLYHGASGQVVGFADVEGKLGISLGLGPAAPVLRDEGERLRVGCEDGAMGEIELSVGDMMAPRARTLPFRESGHVEVLRRLPRRAPPAARLAPSLVGSYRSHDLDADAWISFDEGMLRMRFQGGWGSRRQRLLPLSQDVLCVEVDDELDPMRYVLTVERRQRAVVGFHITFARTRRLRFVRLD